MRGLRFAVTLVLLAAGTAAVRAAEVVEFVDGRYLEIRSHRVSGPLIRLDVAQDSFLVVPQSCVDAIRRDRQVVFRGAAAARPVHAQAARVDDATPDFERRASTRSRRPRG